MPEEVLFESKRTQTREEIAAYLRQVANKLDAGEPITLTAGDRSVTLEPPSRSTFEVKAEREVERGQEAGELSVEFEFEWDDPLGDADGPLEIE